MSSIKIDRLLGILTILLQNDRVTAPFLAEKFEVNRRTIGRDIDTLCRAGIPVITHQGTGGGISIAEGFKLDKTVLTASELAGIIAALKGIGSVSEQSQIERTLDKLGANANAGRPYDRVVSPPVVIDLASYHKGDLTKKIETIKRCIFEKRVIEFDYFYDKGEVRRRIEPHIIVFQWASWYVFGFCRKRLDWRMFKLNRLCNLAECEESFIMREIPPEKREFGNHFTDEIKLIAVFDKSAKHRLIESHGIDSFHEDDAGLHFEFSYTNRSYVISWLLGFGDKVKVLNPHDLIVEIQNIAKNILARYSESS
ncbi:MAG: YafY family transcriptional regulator [Defluviitaleaceae bacterium]|nr:YafY family transcriptional regulator [Defluviitaleaceae bacterium]